MIRRLALTAAALTGVPLAVAWIISQNVLHPKRRVEDHTIDDFDLPAEAVSFAGRDGTPLAGWFIPAPGGAPSPAIVLTHGWARSRAELLPHADFLHRAGYAVLSFDTRHRGESGGDAVTMGLRERHDLLGALDYLCGRPEVDPAHVGAFGMSTGGVVTILVAAEDRRLCAVAVEAPFADRDAVMVRALRHYYRLPSFPIADLAKAVIERRLGESMDPVQPARVVAAVSPRPLFVIADERDAVVGVEQTLQLFEAAAEPKSLWLIPGADHARGWQGAPAEYEQRVIAFFNEHLAAGRADPLPTQRSSSR
jgi:dipeptidyl aminopeptidase/acylaminoacyl peptidase